MNSLIISCETNRPEIERYKIENGYQLRTVYLKADLHDRPDRLRKKIQQVIEQETDAEQILFAMGYCGQALVGLKAGRSRLVIPKVDDCLSLFLGSMNARKAADEKGAVYYFTKGWLDSERGIRNQYAFLCKRLGVENAETVFEIMFENYKRIALIDLALFPIEPQIEEFEKVSILLGLPGEIITGTTHLLNKLMTGPYDDDFIVIPPYGESTMEQFSFLFHSELL